MAINIPFNEARQRRFAELLLASQQRNLDHLKELLLLAGVEYPEDAELESFRHQLFLMEHAESVARTLFRHGRHQIQSGNYEAGLAKLQQAHQIDSTNREIQALLFDTLVDFAKLIVDHDPERARRLLQEAEEISPLNLRLGSIRNHVADRIRQRSVEECLTVVQGLREKGQFREALEEVVSLTTQLQSLQIPALEEMRQDLLDNLGMKPAEPVREVERKLWHDVTAAAGKLQLRQSLREANEKIASTLRISRLRVQGGWKSARSLMTRSRIAYSLAAGVACLVLVFASAMIGRSTVRKPELKSVGTGTLLQSVTLVRGPAENSGVAGALKIGQQIDLLRQIPEAALDAWALIRSVDDPATSGYVRLQNLDRVQTDDRQFNLWVAMSLLDRSSSPIEFRNRLEHVDQMIKADPPAPSRGADQIFLTLSKAFARLASESTGNPAESETARSALFDSEAYLKRIEGALQFSEDADTLQHSIPRMRAALERTAAAKKPSVARGRHESEEVRIMRLAKSAFAMESYEAALKYCAQVLKINQRNVEARKLMSTVRRAQSELEGKIVRQ